MRTRTKIAIGVGLAVLVLGITAAVCDWMPPAEPPLQAGMTLDEAVKALVVEPAPHSTYRMTEVLVNEAKKREGKGDTFVLIGIKWAKFDQGPDAFGNKSLTTVYFEDDRLTRWEVEPLPRVRPPWLDKAKQRAGW